MFPDFASSEGPDVSGPPFYPENIASRARSLALQEIPDVYVDAGADVKAHVESKKSVNAAQDVLRTAHKEQVQRVGLIYRQRKSAGTDDKSALEQEARVASTAIGVHCDQFETALENYYSSAVAKVLRHPRPPVESGSAAAVPLSKNPDRYRNPCAQCEEVPGGRCGRSNPPDDNVQGVQCDRCAATNKACVQAGTESTPWHWWPKGLVRVALEGDTDVDDDTSEAAVSTWAKVFGKMSAEMYSEQQAVDKLTTDVKSTTGRAYAFLTNVEYMTQTVRHIVDRTNKYCEPFARDSQGVLWATVKSPASPASSFSPGPSSAKRVKFADNNDKGARTKDEGD